MIRPILALFAALLAGCAGMDPLGSLEPGKDQETAALTARGGVICREITGQLDTGPASGYGAGFRCLDIGEEPVQGCMTYSTGRFAYTSPGCTELAE